jgi:recombination protein RecT
VLLAAMQAAAVGLEPNTPTQEAWLLPRKNKGTMEAQLSIGYRGYLKLARRSGEILDIWAEVVKEGDEFDYVLGLHRDLTHRPAPASQRGDNTHAYAVVRYRDGGLNFVVLDRIDVEARRGRSDSYRFGKDYSPWTTSPDAMWRKSALRALVPYLPLAAQAASVVASDESPLAFDDDAGVIQATTVEPDDVPELGPAEDA